MRDEQTYYLTIKEFGCSNVEELLDYYLDGEMIPSLLLRFEAHLKACESCRNLAEDCQHILGLAKTLGDYPIAPEVQQRLREALQKAVGHSPQNFENKVQEKTKLSLVLSE